MRNESPKKTITLLIFCGQGLEEFCSQEVQQKLGSIPIHQNPYGLKGYIIVEIPFLVESLPTLAQFLKTFRCFETIYLIINQESLAHNINFKEFGKFKQNIRSFLQNPLILSLKRKNISFLCQLFSMLYSIEMSLTQVEVSAAFPFSFPNNFNQAMVQAMAKHILQHYHRSLTQKGDNILRFSLKIFPDQIFALIQLNLHPGNFTSTYSSNGSLSKFCVWDNCGSNSEFFT